VAAIGCISRYRAEPICSFLHPIFLKKTGIITLKMHPKTLKNGQYKLPPSLRGSWGGEQIGSGYREILNYRLSPVFYHFLPYPPC